MTLSSIYIIIAGVLWGSMGLFVRHLTEAYGLSSMQISAVRLFSAGIFFILFALFTDKSRLRIHLRDLPLLIAMSLFSVLLMSVTYFESINLSSLSVAAILLYTAPIIVMVASCLLFKEKFTLKKALALILAFGGCVLVSGIAGGEIHVSPMGILMGLLSGLFYALYSIFGKFALRHHHPFTVTAYAFTFAGIGSFFFATPASFAPAFQNAGSIPAMLAKFVITGIVTAFLPFLLYTVGLKKTEAGKAAVMASVEPMVASIIGIFILREPTDLYSVIGILSILAAVIILNLNFKNSN